MVVKLTYILGGAATVLLYVAGVYLLVTTPGSQLIPTPAMGVVGGVLAMFATVGVFILGFVFAGTAKQPGAKS